MNGLDDDITQKMNFSVLPLLHFGAVVCQVAGSKGVENFKIFFDPAKGEGLALSPPITEMWVHSFLAFSTR
jgi:hypothetical protein